MTEQKVSGGVAQRSPVALQQILDVLQPFDRAALTSNGYVVGLLKEDFTRVRELISQIDDALAAQPPAAPVEPAHPVPLLKYLVDWTYLHASEGQVWPSSKTADELISKCHRAPTQADADAMKSAPDLLASQNTAERGPSVTLGWAGADTACRSSADTGDDENAKHIKLVDIIYGSSSLNMTAEVCSAQAHKVAEAILKVFTIHRHDGVKQ